MDTHPNMERAKQVLGKRADLVCEIREHQLSVAKLKLQICGLEKELLGLGVNIGPDQPTCW